MPDLLVKLYELPALAPLQERLLAAGIKLRHPLAFEKKAVVEWVNREFGAEWASECEVAFARQPISCFIAVQDGKIIGFACYDVTAKGFFGPTGVTAEARGQGVGRALLLAALHGLAEMGYAYAIIGGAGPVDFYRKAVGAIEIEGSEPGIYRDWLPTGERT
ncbi:MAG TPA: GNAT family N-acetyltransferase [Firmicutes bacterium]|uniref:GNAT family N-acetyltransferase n=1 Tax=Capillibacterium thermochitinicola TaxID=2699427 RepID=A0A8J6HZU4_9FIRM|nr:GNAT family N-acetyltransferase [Capillibacterium thermochitinicola]MBA2132975.1 GNAT family N-acetyltransferase [Capillibacterium thermochitinicola]HHW12752.1 GNAT family N-acetyltransferase [Bacillota bacterium]